MTNPTPHHRKLAEALFEVISKNAPGSDIKRFYIDGFAAVLAAHEADDPGALARAAAEYQEQHGTTTAKEQT